MFGAKSGDAAGLEIPIGRGEELPRGRSGALHPLRLLKSAGTLLSANTSRNYVFVMADQAVASLTNFFTGLIIGRTCTKEEFGLYTLGFSIVLFFTSMQMALISNPYSIHCPRLKGSLDQARFAGSTMAHQIFLSAISIVILAGGGLILSRGIGPSGLDKVVWILASMVVFHLFRSYARQYCFARLLTCSALVLDVCVGVIQTIGLLGLAHFGLLSAKSGLAALGVAGGVGAAGLLTHKRADFSLRPQQIASDFGRNWSLGKWFLAYTLAFTASSLLYPWILASFHGTSATGVLAACTGVVFLANPFMLGMSNLLNPKISHAFARGQAKEAQRVVVKGTYVFLIVMGPFCLSMFLFGNHVLRLMYGPKYGGYGAVVAILALGQLVSSSTASITSGLSVMKRPDAGFKSYALALLVTLTLGLWLVKAFGPIGAAYSLLAGNTTASIYQWLTYRATMRGFTHGNR